MSLHVQSLGLPVLYSVKYSKGKYCCSFFTCVNSITELSCQNFLICYLLIRKGIKPYSVDVFYSLFNVPPVVCGGSVFGPCSVMQYKVTFLVLQSSSRGKESWMQTNYLCVLIHI